MRVTASYGIVTACHAGDYFLAKATCASIRQYMPDVPICVIVDGDFSINELVVTYGVVPLRVADCQNKKLREMCSHSTRSKLLAQWEGPFEYYLWVDCDTIVLGDFVYAEPWGEADFWPMTSKMQGSIPDKNLRHFFMDPDLVLRYDPEFDPHRHPLFCDGAYVARSGCLDFDRTYRMWKATEESPNLFSWTKCQGLTNYIVFSSVQSSGLKVRVSDRQFIITDHSRQAVEQMFGSSARPPQPFWKQAEVVHFCGQKPLLQNRRAYSALFTAFRLQHYRNLYGTGFVAQIRAWSKILAEEWRVFRPRLARKLFPSNL